MNPPPDSSVSHPAATSLLQRSWTLRFFRWLFTARILGRVLAVVLTLVTLVVLFYVEEKVRGRWAWNRCKKVLEQQGLSVEVKSVTPPTLPREANFACSPALLPVYEVVSRQQRPLGKSYEQFQARLDEPRQMATNLGYAHTPDLGGHWRKAAWPDPYKMLGERQKGTKVEPPASPEKAAELVLEIFRKSTGPLLDELQVEAEKRRYTNFDINYDTDDPFGILIPYLAGFKSLGYQSASRASAELYLKQSNAAFRDTLFSLHMSETLKDDPFLISFLVSVALREISFTAVWYGLASRQWNASELEQLQARLAAMDYMVQAQRALNAERVLGQRGIEGFARRFPHQIAFSDLGGPFDGGVPSFENQLLEKCLSYVYPKGWFYFESVNYQRLFVGHFLAASPSSQGRLDLNAIEAEADQAGAALLGPPIALVLKHQYLSSLLLPALGKVYRRAANCQMANTMAATACALERFRLDQGRYPSQLADLSPKYLKQVPLDLLSGEPLKYKVDAAGGCMLYSVGPNGLDEGGKLVLHKSGRVNMEEGDWVWQYPPSR